MSPHLEKVAIKLRSVMPLNTPMKARVIVGSAQCSGGDWPSIGCYLSTIASFPESGIKRIEHGLYERVK